ncbi:hypothetical protein HDU91_002050, partial [Kappamyces sp. JEL0680]
IVNELWNAGISVDISYHDSLGLNDDWSVFKHDYTFAVVLKPRAHDSFVIKVRNLATKAESEVPRSALVALLQGSGKARKESVQYALTSPTEDFETASSVSARQEVIHIPMMSKKGGQRKGNVSMLLEKAASTVSVMNARSKIFVIELTAADLGKLSPAKK